MKKNYKIEIGITPKYRDHPKKPYYWMIMSNTGKDWCNEFFSWAISPDKAWQEAYEHYNTFKKPTEE